MFPVSGSSGPRIFGYNGHYTFHDVHDGRPPAPATSLQAVAPPAVAPPAVASPSVTPPTVTPPPATDFNVRHAHYRRIPNSQRSLSPPPPPRKPLSFKTLKNVFCLPLHRGNADRSGDDADEHDEETEQHENARVAKPTADVSILSSEEQTRAPEGDRLPIFTRLRDWTEHERSRMDKGRKDDGEEDEEEDQTHVPERPASMPSLPAKISTPTAVTPEERTASEGHIPTVRQRTPTPLPKVLMRKPSPRERIEFLEVMQPPPQLQLLPIIPPKIPLDGDDANGVVQGGYQRTCLRRKSRGANAKGTLVARARSQHYHSHHHHHLRHKRSDRMHGKKQEAEESHHRHRCKKHYRQQQHRCQRRRSVAERIATTQRREVAWEPVVMPVPVTMHIPGGYPAEKGMWRVFEAPQQWHDVRVLT
ncbi:hypothetical protein TWF696_001224 [Orbilia brochopaga]|uniref:Uncharacterized protein n=1 Tax=Orbilia brochopaga TaxID=3140254 RepID=A0AAV9UCG7_9PEZI